MRAYEQNDSHEVRNTPYYNQQLHPNYSPYVINEPPNQVFHQQQPHLPYDVGKQIVDNKRGRGLGLMKNRNYRPEK